MATRTSWTSQKKPSAGANSKGSDLHFERCDVIYTSLSDKLDALEQEVQPKWLTLEWVTTAVDFMRSSFADMMILFEDVRALMPEVRAGDEVWIEEYMVESMKLLDVCNVLKPAFSRFENFMMCVQLVVQAVQRCGTGSHHHASNKALQAALRSCESELNQLVHPPLTMVSSHTSTQTEMLRLAPKASKDGPQRHASIAIGEKFTAEKVNAALPFLGPGKLNNSGGSSSGKASRSTVALTLVMRATRETTDFVASVLVWALKRDPSAHPASTAWQQNLEVFRGDDTLWSPSFRRLQERLRKELSEAFRDERSVRRQFAFEEFKLVEDCVGELRLEMEGLAAREKLGEEPSMEKLEQQLMEKLEQQLMEKLEQQLVELLDKIQIRLEKVSTQVNLLFDELVQARKKLLDAAQRPGRIHRAHTF